MISGKRRIPQARIFRRAVLAGAAAALILAFPAAASEWQKDGEDWILTENGQRLTGWQQKDGSWYYLGGDGIMQTRWVYLDNTWYYLRDSGEMAVGWTEVDGFWYYMESDGSMRRQDLTTDEAVYRFRSDGSLDRVRQLKNQGGGAYRIDFFSEDQQEIADELNELRKEENDDVDVEDDNADDYDRGENALYSYDWRRCFEFDGILQKTAEHRLDLAIRNGYSASSIPGEGKVEDYLKNIGSSLRSRRHLEIYFHGLSDGSSVADKLETRFGENKDDAEKRASYYRYAGIAEKRVNGKYYVMIELFR
jgi:hypothetical protein